MEWVVSLLGAGLVLAALRDLFHTLWHPTRRGGVSRLVMAGMWQLAHRFRVSGGGAQLVGPLAMVAVVVTWAFIIVSGWALVYLPHMPEQFSFSEGLEQSEHADLIDSVYLSLVTVATLGIGDIAPTGEWLRVVAPLEALVGFALLTASVSWVLEIYPALSRRRSLALRLAVLRRTQPGDLRPDAVHSALLDSLSVEVIRVRVDVTQYPEAYYFFDGEGDLSLALNIDYARTLAGAVHASGDDAARWSGSALSEALDDLAVTLDQRILHTGGTPTDIYAAYARDHRLSAAR